MKKFHNSNLRVLALDLILMLIISVVLFDNYIKYEDVLMLVLGALFIVFIISTINSFREIEINKSTIILRNQILKSETKIPLSSIEKVEAERVFLSARALLSITGIFRGGSLSVILRTTRGGHIIFFTSSILQSQEKDAQEFVRALMKKIGEEKVNILSRSFFDK
ncbi:hypothetical protein KKE92_04865 [Candidatus Micrarchaeota archaeon]|nr:hypothetical protein [Candidatus Micrarchaeota archaeon]